MEYNFKAVEKKWQDLWYSQNTFAAKDDYSLPKYYCLVEFPYPSGQGNSTLFGKYNCHTQILVNLSKYDGN